MISEKYVLIFDLIYLSALSLKYFRANRTRLSRETWTIRKYSLYVIVLVSNLKRCSQNLGDGFDFISLAPPETDAREIDLFVVLILPGCSMLLESEISDRLEVFQVARARRFVTK